MSGSAIRAGKIFVEIFGKNTALMNTLKKSAAGLKRFGAGVQNVGRKMAMLGSAVTLPLLGAAKRYASVGDQLHKMSKKVGITVEELSLLKFAAEQSGSSLEGVGTGMKFMTKNVGEASLGISKELLPVFEMLNVDPKKLSLLQAEDQFFTLVDAIAAMTNESERTAATMKVFGRSGHDLKPLFEKGAAGIKELKAEAKAAGLQMSTESAEGAAKLTDTLNKLTSTMDRVAIVLGEAISGPLIKFFEMMTPIIKDVLDWVQENQELVATIFAAATALTALSVGVVGVGIVISSLGTIIGFVANLISSPWLLAVAGISAALFFLLKDVQAIRDTVSSFGETIAETFDGVREALAVGDFASAWQIAIIGLEIIWVKFTNILGSVWDQIWVTIGVVFFTALSLIKTGFFSLGKIILKILKNIVQAADGLFVDLIPDSFAAKLERIEKTFSKLARNASREGDRNVFLLGTEFAKDEQRRLDRVQKLIDKQKELRKNIKQTVAEEKKAAIVGPEKVALDFAKRNKIKLIKPKTSRDSPIGSFGSFNARALAGVSETRIQKQQLDEQKKTAKEVKNLRELVEEREGLAFT